MPCPFCNNEKVISTQYPASNFNTKRFLYVRCTKCRLVYLSVFPDLRDYIAMYPPAYQNSVVQKDIMANPYIKLPGLRYSYGYQFDLIIKQIGHKARILDYGCGTGHFIGNASANGFNCDGAEFSPEYLFVLREGFPQKNFFTITDVLSDTFSEKYDVIRLSNVLEHLTHPAETIRKLTGHLEPNGILLIEGPIEDNFCIATGIKKLYFKIEKIIKPNRVISAPPFHIFFSNKKNQRQFFYNCGLIESHFSTSEDPWPFPVSFRDAKGVKKKMMALAAKISIFATKSIGKNWGNIFIYTGRAH